MRQKNKCSCIHNNDNYSQSSRIQAVILLRKYEIPHINAHHSKKLKQDRWKHLLGDALFSENVAHSLLYMGYHSPELIELLAEYASTSSKVHLMETLLKSCSLSKTLLNSDMCC